MSRALITLTGADVISFLQGIITQDIADMQESECRFGAMLSPQGKWQHDFFLIRTAEGIAVDIAAHHRDIFIKKLKLYKMRADVHITPRDDRRCVFLPATSALGTTDPRDARLPKRLWIDANAADPSESLSEQAYHAQRVALAIPEGGIEATEQETLLDLSYDLLHAVSFSKGCYVGQEVTARMHYKSIVRKGFVAVSLQAPLSAPPALPLMLQHEGQDVAELRSVQGTQGIAYGKFEAISPLLAADWPLSIAGIHARLIMPDWQVSKFEKFLTPAG